jgi:hypothetical protein
MCPFVTPQLDSNRRPNLLLPGMAGAVLLCRYLGIFFRGSAAPQSAILSFDLLKFVLCGPAPGIPKSYSCGGVEAW